MAIFASYLFPCSLRVLLPQGGVDKAATYTRPRVHPRIAERAKEPRYTFPEAAAFIGRPVSTVRRWSVGNVRHPDGVTKRDEPLIEIDGFRSTFLLSFLTLLELRFLASYRQRVPLQSIRRALEFAASELHEARPLLRVEFQARGKSLFLKFIELGGEYLVDASLKGQLAWSDDPDEVWPSALDEFMKSVDYDSEEHSAHRWWLLGRQAPVIIDTLFNGGRPSTALAGVRTNAIALHRSEGLIVPEIATEVSATEDEVRAALEFERLAA